MQTRDTLTDILTKHTETGDPDTLTLHTTTQDTQTDKQADRQMKRIIYTGRTFRDIIHSSRHKLGQYLHHFKLCWNDLHKVGKPQSPSQSIHKSFHHPSMHWLIHPSIQFNQTIMCVCVVYLLIYIIYSHHSEFNYVARNQAYVF